MRHGGHCHQSLGELPDESGEDVETVMVEQDGIPEKTVIGIEKPEVSGGRGSVCLERSHVRECGSVCVEPMTSLIGFHEERLLRSSSRTRIRARGAIGTLPLHGRPATSLLCGDGHIDDPVHLG